MYGFFYIDGKFILELSHRKEGDRNSWVPVPKKTYWPPPAAAGTPRQESSTSLSGTVQLILFVYSWAILCIAWSYNFWTVFYFLTHTHIMYKTVLGYWKNMSQDFNMFSGFWNAVCCVCARVLVPEWSSGFCSSLVLVCHGLVPSECECSSTNNLGHRTQNIDFLTTLLNFSNLWRPSLPRKHCR